MKKLFVALAALSLAAPAFAQDGRVGLGVGLPAAGSKNPAPVELLVPIRIAPNIRIEPYFGVWSEDYGGTTGDYRILKLGCGAFLVQRLAPSVDIYGGGRLSLGFAKHGIDDGTDVAVAAAGGAEYFLAPKFSLGLEAQLGFYSNSSASGDASGFFTEGRGLLKVYF